MSRASALELGLRQKLTLMENALAQIASVKAQLRTNADQARKDIAASTGQLIELVRAREQALLEQLDDAVESKEDVLARQQEHLNQGIGACQQSLEVVRRSGGDDVGINVQDMLFRLTTMELSPRANSKVAFEADSLGLRSVIAEFGRVCSTDKAPTHGRSLPLALAEHEDDMDMGHKSVLRYQHDGAVLSTDSVQRGRFSATNPQNVESIREWLARSPSGFEEFEIVRSKSGDRASPSLTTSSVEVIEEPASAASSVISGAFREQLRAPIEQWLPGHNKIVGIHLKYRKSVQTGEPRKSDLPANALKRRTSADEVVRSSGYDFERVIRSIQDSDDAHWITSGKRPRTQSVTTMSVCSLTTTTEEVNESGEDEDEGKILKNIDIKPSIPLFFPTSTVSEEEELATKLRDLKANASTPSTEEILAKLATQFASQRWVAEGMSEEEKRTFTANDLAKDVNNWDANILERIHACGEDNWLSPASRNL